MRCPSVCPSGCVSVTFVHSVKTNKHIFKIFHRLVATPFYFFNTKRHDNISTAIHLAATDRGESKMTLVTGEQQSLLMVGNDKVYDKKP